MQIVFKVLRGDFVADLTQASKDMLSGLTPIEHADLMKDVLFDAQQEYNRARERCGFEPMEWDFP